MISIGRGRCADILAIDDALALKLYERQFDRETVDRWASICRAVSEAGIPAGLRDGLAMAKEIVSNAPVDPSLTERAMTTIAGNIAEELPLLNRQLAEL